MPGCVVKNFCRILITWSRFASGDCERDLKTVEFGKAALSSLNVVFIIASRNRESLNMHSFPTCSFDVSSEMSIATIFDSDL